MAPSQTLTMESMEINGKYKPYIVCVLYSSSNSSYNSFAKAKATLPNFKTHVDMCINTYAHTVCSP